MSTYWKVGLTTRNSSISSAGFEKVTSLPRKAALAWIEAAVPNTIIGSDRQTVEQIAAEPDDRNVLTRNTFVVVGVEEWKVFAVAYMEAERGWVLLSRKTYEAWH